MSAKRDLIQPNSLLVEGQRVLGPPLEGAHGHVYVLRNEKPGALDPALVCAKTLSPDLDSDGFFRRVFQEESQTWLSLGNYDHVVKAYAFRRIDDRPFVFMEYVQDGSLQVSLRRLLSEKSSFVAKLGWLSGDLPRRRLYLRLCTLLGIGRAMLFFHSQTGRVHCDLKPSNVLIARPVSKRVIIPDESVRDTEDGRIEIASLVPEGMNLARLGQWLTKVSDFGYSRIAGASSLGCTREYAAPEQLEPGGEVDARTDVYGFGATAFFTLFDEQPHLKEGRIRPRCGSEGVPPAVLDLLGGCLSPAREDRPSGFQEIVDLLLECVEDEFGVHVPEPWDRETLESDLLSPLVNNPDIASIKYDSGAIDEVSLLSYGDNLFICGDPSAASRYYRKALVEMEHRKEGGELNLGRRLCHDRLGLCQLLLGKEKETQTHFKKGLFPDLSERLQASAVAERGLVVAERLGHKLLGLVFLHAAHYVDDKDPEIYYNTAVTERNLGNFRQAACEAQRALDCLEEPAIRSRISTHIQADYHAVLGACLNQAGELKEAAAHFREAARLHPENESFKQSAESIEDNFDSGDADALCKSGCVLLDAGRSEEALELFESAITIDSNHVRAWYNRGLALGSSGSPLEEIRSYERALKIDPKYERAWFNLGAAWAQIGDASRALPCFDQLVALNPRDVEAWFFRTVALEAVGNTQGALDSIEEVIALTPKNGQAWLHKGRLLKNHFGDTDAANDCFNKAFGFGCLEAEQWLK